MNKPMKFYDIQEYKGYQFTAIEHKVAWYHWFCGYVKLNNMYLNTDYLDIPIECHGGITFKDELKEINPQIDNGIWIGFDTNHIFDDETTQNEEFITEECKRIIDQLLKLEKADTGNVD